MHQLKEKVIKIGLSFRITHKVIKLFLFTSVFLSLSACNTAANKTAKVDVQKVTSEQDILDIVEIVTERFDSVLGKSLTSKPVIKFVSTEELKEHIQSHQYVERDNLTTLNHYTHSVSAIYCSFDKTILVVPENFKIYQQHRSSAHFDAYYLLLAVISHEMIHSLQDQEGLLNWEANSKEERYISSMLVEGHAVMQNALILRSLGLIKDVYSYGVSSEIEKTDDKAQYAYSKRLAKKYHLGKKYFNKVHKKHGNEETWKVLEQPSDHIKEILKTVKQGNY